MRQIGSIPAEDKAARFVDYLLTQEISAHYDEDDASWIIWIRDENDVDKAKEELRIFQANPDSSVYRAASRTADSLRQEDRKRRLHAKKNLVAMRSSWSAPLSRRAPVLMGLLIGCVVVAFMGGGLTGTRTTLDAWLLFDDPANASFTTGARFVHGFGAIKQGQIWRLVTPIFLHGGALHLIFNLYWMYVLGGQIESRIGHLRFAALVLVAAIIPNIWQNVITGPNFVGISGVVFALFGYLWVRRKDGYLLSDSTIMIVMIMFVLGFTPLLGRHIAVWAHAGGLVVGAAIGYLPEYLAKLRRGS